MPLTDLSGFDGNTFALSICVRNGRRPVSLECSATVNRPLVPDFEKHPLTVSKGVLRCLFPSTHSRADSVPSVCHSRYPHYSWASQASSEEPSFCLLISFCNIIQDLISIIKKSPFFFSGNKMEIRKASVWSKLNRRQVAEVGMHAQAGQSDAYRNSLSLSPWLGPPVPVPDVM